MPSTKASVDSLFINQSRLEESPSKRLFIHLSTAYWINGKKTQAPTVEYCLGN